MNPHQVDVVLEIASAVRNVLGHIGRAPFERSLSPLVRSELSRSQRAVDGVRAIAGWGRQGRAVVNGARIAPTSASFGSCLGRALHHVTAFEQRVSSTAQRAIDRVPGLRGFGSAMPAHTFPALAFGMPHAHAHPPNVLGPGMIPIALPSFGVSLPWLGHARKTRISGQFAVRCGDLGIAYGCGGFIPNFEILTGSSKVWIEGQRAARGGVDMSGHCILSTPRPTDPPLGPKLGATVPTQFTVQIGGFPMPSATALVMSVAFRSIFAGVRHGFLALRSRVALVERLAARVGALIESVVLPRATRLVDRLLALGNIRIAPGEQFFALRAHLIQLATTRTGRAELRALHASGVEHLFRARSGPPGMRPSNYEAALLREVPDHVPGDARLRQLTGDLRVVNVVRGPGSGSRISLDPVSRQDDALRFAQMTGFVAHEGGHGVMGAQGLLTKLHAQPERFNGAFNHRFQDLAEWHAVTVENSVREELGLSLRQDYSTVMPE